MKKYCGRVVFICHRLSYSMAAWGDSWFSHRNQVKGEGFRRHLLAGLSEDSGGCCHARLARWRCMHGHWKTLSDKVMKEQERSGRKEEERTTSFEERATFHRMRTRSILYDPEGNDNQSVVSANVYFGSDDESEIRMGSNLVRNGNGSPEKTRQDPS